MRTTLDKVRKRYYGGRKNFLRIARVNGKSLTIADVINIENDNGRGCMSGVERYRQYLELNGLEIIIRPIP